VGTGRSGTGLSGNGPKVGTALSLTTSGPAQSWISRLLSLSYLTGLSWHKLLGAAVCAGVALHAGAWISHWAGPPSTRPGPSVRFDPASTWRFPLWPSACGPVPCRPGSARLSRRVRAPERLRVRHDGGVAVVRQRTGYAHARAHTHAHTRARTHTQAHTNPRAHARAHTLAVLWRRPASAVPLRHVPT
jgi:hypothetical protein